MPNGDPVKAEYTGLPFLATPATRAALEFQTASGQLVLLVTRNDAQRLQEDLAQLLQRRHFWSDEA